MGRNLCRPVLHLSSGEQGSLADTWVTPWGAFMFWNPPNQLMTSVISKFGRPSQLVIQHSKMNLYCLMKYISSSKWLDGVTVCINEAQLCVTQICKTPMHKTFSSD